MSFMVSNRPAFEIPLTEVANTTQPSKNEVSIELVGPGRAGEGDRRQKSDTLTEIRFFVPGMATASQVGENAEGKKQLKDKEDALKADEGHKEDGEIAVDDEELAVNDEGETISSASILFETIKQKADIDVLHSETIVSFNGLLCITPRYERHFLCKHVWLLTLHAVVVSRSTFMPPSSAFVGSRTTTRFSTRRSKLCSCCRNRTSYIICLLSVLTHLSARGKLGIPSLYSNSAMRMKLRRT